MNKTNQFSLYVHNHKILKLDYNRKEYLGFAAPVVEASLQSDTVAITSLVRQAPPASLSSQKARELGIILAPCTGIVTDLKVGQETLVVNRSLVTIAPDQRDVFQFKQGDTLLSFCPFSTVNHASLITIDMSNGRVV